MFASVLHEYFFRPHEFVSTLLSFLPPRYNRTQRASQPAQHSTTQYNIKRTRCGVLGASGRPVQTLHPHGRRRERLSYAQPWTGCTWYGMNLEKSPHHDTASSKHLNIFQVPHKKRSSPSLQKNKKGKHHNFYFAVVKCRPKQTCPHQTTGSTP